MLQDVREIAAVRKRLGLTQRELAMKAQVSQSYITKVERGLVEPTYAHARRIFDVLEKQRFTDEHKATEFMNRHVISVHPSTRATRAAMLMQKKGISQLPVVQKGKAVGIISEGILLKHLDQDLSRIDVGVLMESPPPTLPGDAGKHVIIALLQQYPLLLIVNKHDIIGVITKTDVLK